MVRAWIERHFFPRGGASLVPRRAASPRRRLGVEHLEERSLLTIIVTGAGDGNTTPPPDDPGFYNVGVRGSGSAVYLGNGWVLTDVHVGAGNTLLNNVWYPAVAGSAIQLTNPAGAGFTAGTDLLLFKIDGDPGLPSITIGSAAPQLGWTVTMIGYGRDRNASTAYWNSDWTPATSPNPYQGYIWTTAQHMRWGTNTISAINMPLGVNTNSENSFMTLFTGTTPYDAQGAPGDSGGGVFHKDASGQWNLIGLMAAVTTAGNQPWGTSVLGNATYIADLSVYRSQIIAALGAAPAVNHAPSGTDKAIATLEDTPYTFTSADFGFSDPSDSPANNFLAVKLTTLPVAGTIADNGVAVIAGQVISLADITSGKLKFTPAANTKGTPYSSFTFQVQDDGGTANGGVDLDSTPNTITLNVTSVNDAPAGLSSTISTLEDTPYTFTTADFGFSDPSDSPPNSFLAVKITTLPAAGLIADNGATVTAGQFVPISDITSGKLKFMPAANAKGAPYSSFTFQVQDDGGTAGGGVDLDPTPNTIALNVTSVNDVPAGQDKTLTTAASTPCTFTLSDFGFSDSGDTPANNLLAVKIATLPGAGTLTDAGAAVVAGQFIPMADITAGNLKFTPAAGTSGTPYSSFTFQVRDDGGTTSGGVDIDPTPNSITINVTPPQTQSSTVSLWSASAVPATLAGTDTKSIELGVRFSASTSGYITGIRYYKSATNTGVHTGSLWSASGQLLATATFTGEGASGWQQVLFSTPVAITAGTTYVASYHTSVGQYSFSRSYFATPLMSGPLTATSGVYLYGAGAVPTQSYQGTNYWVDVLFSTTAPADTTPPTVVNVVPSNGLTGIGTNTAPTVTFSEAVDPATVNSSTVQLQSGSTAVAATVTYDASTKTATITPAAALTNSTTYTILVVGGTNGVKDLAANVLATSVSSSFVTAAATQTSTYSLWSTSAMPATVDGGDAKAIELGVKFTASTSGFITGIRFYKSAANTGAHTGSLWSANGQLLASVTFSGEGGTGWQQASFSTPVAVAAGATYVASYHTTVGHYSVSRSYFSSPYTSGPLTATTGVYLYGAGGFPTQSYQASNYWVDVVFSSAAPVDATPPSISAFSPASGATGVATSAAPGVTFSEAMDPATINNSTVRLLSGTTTVAATVSYNASTKTANITPTVALANSTTYTIQVIGGASGVKDLAGNARSADATSTFTTAAAAQQSTSSTLWNSSATPATVDSGDASAIELGVKFTATTSGFITGIRYYKSAANTGVHTGSLWSSTGQLLAAATFSGEGASGWQQVNFSTPVAVTPGTTCVASYHTTVGHYSVSRSYFSSAYTNAPLQATAGVYLYGAGGFPTQSYQASNYWVDVVFSRSL